MVLGSSERAAHARGQGQSGLDKLLKLAFLNLKCVPESQSQQVVSVRR